MVNVAKYTIHGSYGFVADITKSLNNQLHRPIYHDWSTNPQSRTPPEIAKGLLTIGFP